MNTLCERCQKPLFEHASDYMVREGHACRGDCKKAILRSPVTRTVVGPKKTNKYGNARTPCSYGHNHASKKEAGHCDLLHLRLAANEITDLDIEPQYEFRIGIRLIGRYKADFRYLENGVLTVEDVKSVATAQRRDFRLRKKMMLAFHGIVVREI